MQLYYKTKFYFNIHKWAVSQVAQMLSQRTKTVSPSQTKKSPTITTLLAIMKTETEVSGNSLKSDTMSGTSDKATDQETVASQEKKVPVKFEYKFKAQKVLMTGSFLNWNTFIEMSKNSHTGLI